MRVLIPARTFTTLPAETGHSLTISLKVCTMKCWYCKAQHYIKSCFHVVNWEISLVV